MALLPMPRLFIPGQPGALAFFYQAGSTTKQDTYTTQSLATPRDNPVVADSSGRFPAIYLDDKLDYKITVHEAGTPDPPLLVSPLFEQDNLQTLGAGSTYLREWSSDQTLDADAAGVDALILADAAQSPFAVSLYSAAGRGGRYVTVKKVDSTDHAVTITANGNEQIDNSGTYELESENNFVRLRSTGTKWVVVASEGGASAGGKRTLADRLLGKTYVDDQWADLAIDGGEVGAAEVTHHTVGAGRIGAIVHEITVTNVSASTRNVRVFIGLASGVSTSVLDAEVLPGDTIPILGPILMGPNDKIISSSPDAAAGDVGLRASVSELASEILDVTLRPVVGVAADVAFASIFTCPAGADHATIESLFVCNTDSVPRTVDVEIRPSGGSAQTYQRVLAHSVLQGDTVRLRSFTLEPGDQVYVKAAVANTVGVKVSAVEWS